MPLPPSKSPEIRASGVRDELIYCRDHRCSHHVETNADGWLVCQVYGRRGADVRSKFPQARMGTS